VKDPKVGERVAVYSADVRRYVAVIKGGPNEVGNILVDVGDEAAWVHPNQCRRLVRRERERIWVFCNENGTYGPDVLKTPPGADVRRVRSKQPNGVWREFKAVKAK
jgi:hypothetical protein